MDDCRITEDEAALNGEYTISLRDPSNKQCFVDASRPHLYLGMHLINDPALTPREVHPRKNQPETKCHDISQWNRDNDSQSSKRQGDLRGGTM